MKKLFNVVLVALFLLGSVSSGYAITGDIAQSPGLQNYEIFGPTGGATGVSPATQVIRVRYGLMNNATKCNSSSGGGNEALASGDVVSWDTNSADGITITKCVASTNAGYAGVLVTDIMTADSMSKRGTERNWGYMAIKGYCLAKVATAAATPSGSLNVYGSTLPGAFGTRDSSATSIQVDTIHSKDIGVLLQDTGVDGLMPVILK